MASERFQSAFEEAGWYKDRKTDVSYVIDDLKSVGCTVPNLLIYSILEEYGNLRINYIDRESIHVDVFFNVDSAIALTSKNSNNKIEIILNEKIVPIGTIANDSYCFWITYSGKCYMTDGTKLYYLGNNMISAIEFIFSDKNPTEIAQCR